MIPIASDGWRFILPLLAVGVGLIFVPSPLGRVGAFISFVLALACAFFFRDFERPIVLDENIIYSPADGTVMAVEPCAGETNGSRAQMVRIFLSVFNVHVQRSPLSGEVKSIQEKPGSYFDARDPKAHLENAQTTMVLSTSNGPIKVTQIAGLIARRIVCWVKPGQALSQGERYGLIRFGSQVDMVIPEQCQVLVKKGDKVRGGLTVVAKWK